MGGEYDKKFDEITGLVQRTVGGLEELSMEVRDIRAEVRAVRADLHINTKETKSMDRNWIATRQFQDVGGMVLRDHRPRINNLLKRVESLESGTH